MRDRAPKFYGRDSDPPTALIIYSLKDRKETTLAEKIEGFNVSRDGSKALVRKGKTYALYDVKPDAKATQRPLPRIT